MSLWYTFKLSLNLEVVAKNGMRKNATEQHHLLIYTMHDISRGFLKQRDRRYKSPSAHISGIYKSSKTWWKMGVENNFLTKLHSIQWTGEYNKEK